MAATDSGGGTNTGTNTGGGSDWLTYAKMISDAYKTYAQSQPGKFKQIPEDPSLVALRQKILGYVGNSPTRNALGDMLSSRLQASNGSSFQLPQGANGYTPYQGKPVSYDLSKILPNIASSDNPNPGGPAGAGSLNPGLPPPPPDVSHEVNAERKQRKKHGLSGLVKGALGGVAGGIPGMIIGATMGVAGAKKENQAQWDAAWAPYNTWKQQYGSSFTDSHGRPVKVETMDDYRRWYQEKYGKPYQG